MVLRWVVGLAVLAIAALGASAPAGAVVTASFSGGSAILSVSLSESGDQAALSVTAGGQILVNGVLPSGNPTNETTQNISVSSQQGNTLVTLDERNGRFAPGIFGTSGPDREINITVSSFSAAVGPNEVRVLGGDASRTIALGGTTINLNADEATDIDSDISLSSIELVSITTGAGADSVSANGGPGVGAGPFTLPLILSTGAGNDIVRGGGAADSINAGAGADQVFARLGGTDTIACGDGTDSLDADRTDARTGCENVPLDATPVSGASVRASFVRHGRLTTVTGMSARNVPAGSRIRLVCTGRTCPFRAKTLAYARAHALVSLKPLFRRRAMRAGTVIVVRVTTPGFIGHVSTWTLRKRKLPKLVAACLPPGSTTPIACP
jgi:hypothetical protein